MGEAKIVSLVKEALKSLCCGNGWSYGAFWSFDQRNSMLLTMEDIYYEEQTVDVVANMLQKVHILGEGIVGQAASLGTHKWIFSDANGGSAVTFQGDSEVYHQFCSGIKTIAVISVKSHGVVQFGSTQKMLEQPEFVSRTRRLFKELESVNGLSSAADRASPLNSGSNELNDQWFDSFCSGNITPLHAGSCNELMELVYRQIDLPKLDMLKESMTLLNPEMSYITNKLHGGSTEDVQASDIQSGTQFQQFPLQTAASMDIPPCAATWSNSSTVTSSESQWSSTRVIQDSTVASCKSEPTTLGCGNIEQNLHGYSFPSAEVESRASGEVLGREAMLIFPREIKMNDFLLDFSNSHSRGYLLDQFPAQQDSMSVPTSLMNESFSPSVRFNPFSSGLVADVPVHIPGKEPAYSMQSSITDAHACEGVQSSLNVSSGEKDLFEGLGLDSTCAQYAQTLEDIMMTGGHLDNSASIVSKGMSDLDVGSSVGPRKALFSELGLGEILCSASGWNCLPRAEDQSSPRKRLKMEASSSLTTSNLTQIANGSRSSAIGRIQPLYNSDSSKTLPIKEEMPQKPMVNLWIDDSYNMNAGSAVLAKPKKIEEPKKVTRKRARPGEGSRPRPKDRQMILDRYAELKKIIPGGEKLTTDGLLDRTIKHLLFLKSVASYADKLKQLDVTKLLDHRKDMRPKENIRNGGGVSWALEVDDESMVCPIIVEDLGPPGLMLIQMLCEDRGFFLEIADMIKDFGLNILKGVTEFKEDKIWARFIVEAKTNITRREVIYFLVKLLEKNSSGKNDFKNEPCHMVEGHIPSSNSYQQPAFGCPVSLTHKLH